MIEDEINRILQGAKEHLSKIVRQDETLRESISELENVVYDYIQDLPGEDKGYICGEFEKYVENCYQDPYETALRFASEYFVSCWLESEEVFNAQDATEDENGFITSADHIKLYDGLGAFIEGECFIPNGIQVICKGAFTKSNAEYIYDARIEGGRIIIPKSVCVIENDAIDGRFDVICESDSFVWYRGGLYTSDYRKLVYLPRLNHTRVVYLHPSLEVLACAICDSVFYLNYESSEDVTEHYPCVVLYAEHPWHNMQQLPTKALLCVPSGQASRFYGASARIIEGEVFIDNHGVVYSKDRKRLICFPDTLPIEKYEVNAECEIIDDSSFLEEITSYGQSYDSVMCFDSNSLKEIILPEGLIEVSFDGCRKLERISIPGSVTKIQVPEEKYNLFSIVVSEQNTVYDSRDCCNAIIKSLNNELILGCSQTTIPDGINSIASYAFFESRIERIIVPTTVRHIGSSAIEACPNLKTLAIMTSDLTIDDKESFIRGCWSLESIELHAKIEGIGYEVFSGLPSLKTIAVPFDCYDFYRRLFSYTPLIRKLKIIN